MKLISQSTHVLALKNLLFEFFVVQEDPLDHQEDRDVRQTQEVRDLVDRVGLDDRTHWAWVRDEVAHDVEEDPRVPEAHDEDQVLGVACVVHGEVQEDRDVVHRVRSVREMEFPKTARSSSCQVADEAPLQLHSVASEAAKLEPRTWRRSPIILSKEVVGRLFHKLSMDEDALLQPPAASRCRIDWIET